MTTANLIQLGPLHWVDPEEVVAVTRGGTVTHVRLSGGGNGHCDLYIDLPLADVLAALGR